jgi:intracellular sulfur oxidation DsrE/DsrF family protein
MTVPRRSFLARLGAAAAAFTAIEASALGAQAQQAPQGPAQRAVLRHPQDAWLDAIPGAHRLIVDGPTALAGAEGALFIWNFLRTSGQPYGLKDSDHAAVLTLRHGGTAFAFPQTLWDKYPTLAEEMEVKHPMTDLKVTKSLLRPGLAAPDALGEAFTLDGVAKRGVHFAICGAATTRISGQIAAKIGKPTEAKTIYEELVASLPANAHVVSSGMVGVQRAQEYGYAYVRAG